MDVCIEIDTCRDAHEELCSLIDWLDHEPGLRGRVTTVRRTVPADELGGAVNAVQVALGAGGGLAALASALRVWFAQPRRSDVRIMIRNGGGTTIELDARRVADVESLLRTALAADEGSDGGAS